VRQQDLQLRETLHHAVEDEMARRDRGLERVADHVVDLDAAQAELLHAIVQFRDRQARILQRHGSQADEALGPLRDDLGDALVHRARELGALARLAPVVGLVRRW